ncbi:basic proline-rich protein-like [Marmota flaviventris]|uniref:basic proline-rich protein-like n=1 Tax=Marmota flaviventris TaxID=93162 RepID=UPI003A893342
MVGREGGLARSGLQAGPSRCGGLLPPTLPTVLPGTYPQGSPGPGRRLREDRGGRGGGRGLRSGLDRAAGRQAVRGRGRSAREGAPTPHPPRRRLAQLPGGGRRRPGPSPPGGQRGRRIVSGGRRRPPRPPPPAGTPAAAPARPPTRSAPQPLPGFAPSSPAGGRSPAGPTSPLRALPPPRRPPEPGVCTRMRTGLFPRTCASAAEAGVEGPRAPVRAPRSASPSCRLKRGSRALPGRPPGPGSGPRTPRAPGARRTAPGSWGGGGKRACASGRGPRRRPGCEPPPEGRAPRRGLAVNPSRARHLTAPAPAGPPRHPRGSPAGLPATRSPPPRGRGRVCLSNTGSVRR